MTSELESFALAPTVVGAEPPVARSDADPLLGTTLDGRYRITECLAEHEATRLYRGVQLSIDRPVAIKVLRTDRSRGPELEKRFVREAQILTNLSHPNIVGLLDSGNTASGEPYLVLDSIRGSTLEAELARLGRFDTRRTCQIAVQLCSAVLAAHSVGIVHCNLEPSNIMVLEDPAVRDVVKLLDFGLAKRTSGSSGSADARDLYALGRVMYEMLTGAPHRGDSLASAPPTIHRSIANLVTRLLATLPEERPSATVVLRELRAWLDGHADDGVATSHVDAKTIVVPAFDGADERPTLHEIPVRVPSATTPPVAQQTPLVTRVLPPTPLIAQPMPAFMRVLPVTPLLAHVERRIPPTPLRARRVTERLTMALADPRVARALVLAALLFVVAGLLLVLAALLS